MQEKRTLIYNSAELAEALGYKNGTKFERIEGRFKVCNPKVDSHGSYDRNECNGFYPQYDYAQGIHEIEITFIEEA